MVLSSVPPFPKIVIPGERESSALARGKGTQDSGRAVAFQKTHDIMLPCANISNSFTGLPANATARSTTSRSALRSTRTSALKASRKNMAYVLVWYELYEDIHAATASRNPAWKLIEKNNSGWNDI
jgi:hypothetical protein